MFFESKATFWVKTNKQTAYIVKLLLRVVLYMYVL